jgi:rod shape-determining protein MreC
LAKVIDNARRSRLMLAGLVLAHLVVIGRQVDAGGGTSLLERVIFTALSPLQYAVSATVGGVRGAWAAYVDLRGVHQENQQLRERLRALETQLQERQERALEAERLREQLELRKILPLDTVLAEVVARDGVPWFRTITIDKGSAHGLALDAPVLSPTGVVGRIVAIGPHAARVQLLLDRDSGVGVLVERTRVTGVVTGQVAFSHAGTTDLVMKYVSALADVTVGDVAVTSGLDRIYPKGLVVGRVRNVGPSSGLFREIIVTPSARFDRMEEVLVVRAPRSETAEIVR